MGAFVSREIEKSEVHDLLQECQGLTRNLEQDVSGLFSSIDMLLSKTQILNDNLSVDKVDDRGSAKEKVHLEKCREAALQLLSATEGIQYCQKQSTMKSLDRLLKFMQRLNIQMEEWCKKEPFEDILPGLYMKDIKRRNTRRNEDLRTQFIEEIEYLRHKNQYAESRTKSSIKECERLKEEKHILQKERNEEAQMKINLEKELKEVCFQKDERIKSQNEIEAQLNEIIKEREEENAKLIKILQNANDKSDSVMVQSEREKDEINIERAHAKWCNEGLRIKSTGEIGGLRQKIQETEIRTITLIEELDRLKEENRILKNEKDEDAQRNKSLENKLTQRTDDYKVLNEQKDERIKELISTEIKLQANMKEKEEENVQLSKTLQNTNDNFDKLMKMFDTEKKMLVAERNEMKKKAIEYQSCLQENEQKINELVNLNKTMQKQNLQNKEHYENKQMALENENHRVQRQLDMLRGDLKAKSDIEKELLEEIRVLSVELLTKNEHIKIVTRQHEDTKLQLTNEISAITEAQLNKRKTMEDRERTLVSELQHVRTANKKLSNQICKEQHASKENESFITGMKEKMECLEEENTKLKRLSTKIAQDLEKCTAENETIRNKLEQIKSRKVIQIQMYSQCGVGLLASVEDELKCALKSKMDIEEGVDVDIINCAKVSDFQPDIPLLILCILASGLGTAVANTVRGLTLTPKMAMLIFHHKDAHALPNQASERVLTGHELRSLGGMFDLAFLSGKGIYNCEMNRANFISLVNFIKREGTKRMRNDL